MFRILISGQDVDLFTNQSFSFILNNPAFVADALKGDKSYPINFPVTDTNKVVFEYLHDTRVSSRKKLFDILVIDSGINVIRGIFEVRDFGNAKIIGNCYTGVSLLFGKMAKKLNEIDFGGDLTDPVFPSPNHYAWQNHFSLYTTNAATKYPFTFFPVKNEQLNEGATDDYLYNTRPRLMGFQSHFIPINAIDASNLANRGFFYHTPNIANTLAPFLTYVVQKIFEDSGFKADGDFFTSPDFEKIVMLSLNIQAYGNDIAKALPADKTAFDLLSALSAKFNIGIFYNAISKTFTLDFNKDLFDYTSVQDWTEKVMSDYIVIPPEKDGYTISDTLDSQDKYAADNIKYPFGADINLKGSVSTFNLLPYSNLKIADVWYVEDQDAWYFCTEEVFPTTASWILYSHHYFPEIYGEGENEIKANLSTGPNTDQTVYMTEDWNCGLATNPNCNPLLDPKTINCPQIAQKGNNALFLDSVGHPAEGNKFGFRLFFWHGIVDSPTNIGWKYVHASGSNYFPNGVKNTDFSLFTQGDEGTYQKFWKPFIDRIGNPLIVTKSVYLTALDYYTVNLKLPVKIGGELFFIKSIKAKFPIKGISSVELIKIQPKINATNNGTA